MAKILQLYPWASITQGRNPNTPTREVDVFFSDLYPVRIVILKGTTDTQRRALTEHLRTRFWRLQVDLRDRALRGACGCMCVGVDFYSVLTPSAGQESTDQCVHVFVREDKGKRGNRECTYVWVCVCVCVCVCVWCVRRQMCHWALDWPHTPETTVNRWGDLRKQWHQQKVQPS